MMSFKILIQKRRRSSVKHWDFLPITMGHLYNFIGKSVLNKYQGSYWSPICSIIFHLPLKIIYNLVEMTGLQQHMRDAGDTSAKFFLADMLTFTLFQPQGTDHTHHLGWSFWCLQLSQKNERKQFDLRYNSKGQTISEWLNKFIVKLSDL